MHLQQHINALSCRRTPMASPSRAPLGAAHAPMLRKQAQHEMPALGRERKRTEPRRSGRRSYQRRLRRLDGRSPLARRAPLFRGVPSWTSEFLDRWLEHREETSEFRRRHSCVTFFVALTFFTVFSTVGEGAAPETQPQLALLFCPWWFRSESPGLLGIRKAVSMPQAEGRATK